MYELYYVLVYVYTVHCLLKVKGIVKVKCAGIL